MTLKCGVCSNRWHAMTGSLEFNNSCMTRTCKGHAEREELQQGLQILHTVRERANHMSIALTARQPTLPSSAPRVLTKVEAATTARRLPEAGAGTRGGAVLVAARAQVVCAIYANTRHERERERMCAQPRRCSTGKD